MKINKTNEIELMDCTLRDDISQGVILGKK